MDNRIYPCRVCGHNFGSPVRDEYDLPNFGICESCGAEAGIHDETIEDIREYRAEWLANGAKWHDRFSSPPENWNVEDQMKNIPPEFI